MLRKTILLYTLLLSTTSASLAQYSPLIENEKFWIFQSYDDSEYGSVISGFILTIEGDTVVNGKTYSLFMQNNLVGKHDCPLPPCFVPNKPYEIDQKGIYALIREDTTTQRIFHLPHHNSNDSEYVLFDFALNEADSLSQYINERIIHNTNPDLYAKVDSLTYEFHYEQNRKVINTTGLWPIVGLQQYYRLKIIEGIGFETYGLFPGTLDKLIKVCYGSYQDCNILSSLDKQASVVSYALTPNPTTDFIHINTDEAIEDSMIFDSQGKLLITTNTKDIDLSSQASGCYLLKINFKSGIEFVEQIIKI